MAKNTGISDAEWEVMNVLWRETGLTASEIARKLEDKDWKPNTVRTFLDRLVQKKAARVVRAEGAGCYEPLWKRGDCIRQEGESFLQRVFQGSPGSLLLHFAEKSKLSPSDVEELRQILDKKTSNRKK
jgi:BlaI family penicillinase repressor